MTVPPPSTPMTTMLTPILISALPRRLAFSPRLGLRDDSDAKIKGKASTARMRSVLVAGLALSSFVLLASVALLSPTTKPTRTAALAATDGRAVADDSEASLPQEQPRPLAAMIDKNCAEHAREKLLAGLTQYYLHRQLLPGTTSDGVADTTAVTGLLANLRDPLPAAPESSCKG
jgi:hypothetical protein